MDSIKVQVKRVLMSDYEQHHYDKESLQASGTATPTQRSLLIGRLVVVFGFFSMSTNQEASPSIPCSIEDRGTDEDDWMFHGVAGTKWTLS